MQGKQLFCILAVNKLSPMFSHSLNQLNSQTVVSVLENEQAGAGFVIPN